MKHDDPLNQLPLIAVTANLLDLVTQLALKLLGWKGVALFIGVPLVMSLAGLADDKIREARGVEEEVPFELTEEHCDSYLVSRGYKEEDIPKLNETFRENNCWKRLNGQPTNLERYWYRHYQ